MPILDGHMDEKIWMPNFRTNTVSIFNSALINPVIVIKIKIYSAWPKITISLICLIKINKTQTN